MNKVLFLTGTRADFGKLKPLIRKVEQSSKLDFSIFVTGMHTLARYGNTAEEVYKTGFNNIYVYMNQVYGDPMDLILANTITGLSRYVSEYKPDMIVVHGDRVEALAGAIVGSLNNILVSHIEGGELSGTIDGVIRHSISKLSHIHFVANNEAGDRLKQLGEDSNSIFMIGSPDIDAMLSPTLPDIEQVKARYDIDFDEYAVVLFHPVTTELKSIKANANHLVQALLNSGKNYVVIYPNNDEGTEEIFSSYEVLKDNRKFKMYPSLRFEYFLTLLKCSKFIIGNSSAGVREAPVYGVYSINVGTRQQDRSDYKSIINTSNDLDDILHAINNVENLESLEPSFVFGNGESSLQFLEVLEGGQVWGIQKQKKFHDLVIK